LQTADALAVSSGDKKSEMQKRWSSFNDFQLALVNIQFSERLSLFEANAELEDDSIMIDPSLEICLCGKLELAELDEDVWPVEEGPVDIDDLEETLEDGDKLKIETNLSFVLFTHRESLEPLAETEEELEPNDPKEDALFDAFVWIGLFELGLDEFET
jgi:hypothetical protein